MSPKVEQINVPATKLGEGPHWDSRTNTLYYVNILESTIHRYVPETGEHAMTKVDTDISVHFVIPIAETTDKFVIAQGRKVLAVRWDGRNDSKVEIVQELAEVDVGNPKNMLNDGKVDPRGRLFTGTIGVGGERQENQPFGCVPTGSLYSLTEDGVVKTHDTGVTISNGLTWDLRRKVMYHVDSDTGIRKFDYNVDTGDISNKSLFFTYKEHSRPGFPDGMTIDTDGNLWVASYGGANVLKINPDTGKIMQAIGIPAKCVTSVSFGGPQLDTLFVTTGYDGDYKGDNPPGGGMYCITDLGGVKGYNSLPFDCNILK